MCMFYKGKLEPLGSLTISGLLLSAGIGAGIHSVDLLRKILTTPSTHTHTHDHVDSLATHSHGMEAWISELVGSGYGLENPSVAAAALLFMVGSIGVKEALYWATLRVAKETQSGLCLIFFLFFFAKTSFSDFSFSHIL
jgi:divalent metal cation (Fe/Co/Zn/Cd) transporter